METYTIIFFHRKSFDLTIVVNAEKIQPNDNCHPHKTSHKSISLYIFKFLTKGSFFTLRHATKKLLLLRLNKMLFKVGVLPSAIIAPLKKHVKV